MRRRRRRLRTTTRRWRAACATRRRRAPSPAAPRVPGAIPRVRCSASVRRRRHSRRRARPRPELTPMLHRRRDVPTTSASPPPRPPGLARTRAGARRDARAGYPRAGTRAGHGARGRDAVRGRPRAPLREGSGWGCRWRQRESGVTGAVLHARCARMTGLGDARVRAHRARRRRRRGIPAPTGSRRPRGRPFRPPYRGRARRECGTAPRRRPQLPSALPSCRD